MTATRVPAPRVPAAQAPADVPRRRRGPALEDAILDATYAELTEAGYLGFSVENVAVRARTGKASIYRRWPTKQHLVMDALDSRLPTPAECGIELEIDDDVTTSEALIRVANAIGQVITGPAGDAMRAIKCEAATDPGLAALVDERFQAPRRKAMLDLLARGVARGEVRPGAVTVLVADVLPAVLMHHVVMLGEQVSPQVVRDIMEQVLIPMVETR